MKPEKKDHYQCVVVDVPERLLDWTSDASRDYSTFSSFTNKPDTIIWVQNNGRHSFAGRVKLEYLQPAIVSFLAKHG